MLIGGICATASLVGCAGLTSAAPSAAPGVFQIGQSNCGNTDTGVSGWTANSRVNLTWVADGVTVNGPAVQAVQSANGNPGGGPGHSYELTMGSDLSNYYNSKIITAKTWVDGATADVFERQAVSQGWSSIMLAATSFGQQCRTAGVTSVVIVHDQGSSECLTVNSSITSLWLARTQSTIASVRAILRAFGVNRIHVLMMQQVSSFSLASGIDSGQLATIRAAAQTFVTNDEDASLFNCDDILLTGGGFHWVGGQTLTIGSRMAKQAYLRLTYTVPARTPLTTFDIFGAGMIANFSPRDLALTDGASVTTLSSRFGLTPTCSGTSTYHTNMLNGLSGLQHNGTSDLMTLSVSLPAPGTTRTFNRLILRQDSWAAAGHTLVGASGSTPAIATVTSSPDVFASNGSAGSTNTKFTLSTFKSVEWQMRNSATSYIGGGSNDLSGQLAGDYLRIGFGTGAVSGGINLGNNALGALQIGGGNGTFAAVSWLDWLILNITPTKDQGDKLLGHDLATFGISMAA